jgi:hypothetical protein
MAKPYLTGVAPGDGTGARPVEFRVADILWRTYPPLGDSTKVRDKKSEMGNKNTLGRRIVYTPLAIEMGGLAFSLEFSYLRQEVVLESRAPFFARIIKRVMVNRRKSLA